jgi:hypothetical protein
MLVKDEGEALNSHGHGTRGCFGCSLAAALGEMVCRARGERFCVHECVAPCATVVTSVEPTRAATTSAHCGGIGRAAEAARGHRRGRPALTHGWGPRWAVGTPFRPVQRLLDWRPHPAPNPSRGLGSGAGSRPAGPPRPAVWPVSKGSSRGETPNV